MPPNGPVATTEHTPSRTPLRLQLGEHPGTGRLDGGWWPQSRDLAVELRDLVEHWPADLSRVVGALVSPVDWDVDWDASDDVSVPGMTVETGSAREDTHVVVLTTADSTVLRVLVVPPGFAPGQGDEALLAATSRGNAHSAADLLDEVVAHPPSVPADHWTDARAPREGDGDAP